MCYKCVEGLRADAALSPFLCVLGESHTGSRDRASKGPEGKSRSALLKCLLNPPGSDPQEAARHPQGHGARGHPSTPAGTGCAEKRPFPRMPRQPRPLTPHPREWPAPGVPAQQGRSSSSQELCHRCRSTKGWLCTGRGRRGSPEAWLTLPGRHPGRVGARWVWLQPGSLHPNTGPLGGTAVPLLCLMGRHLGRDGFHRQLLDRLYLVCGVGSVTGVCAKEGAGGRPPRGLGCAHLHWDHDGGAAASPG